MYLLFGLSMLFAFQTWLEMDTASHDKIVALASIGGCLFVAFIFSYIMFYFPP